MKTHTEIKAKRQSIEANYNRMLRAIAEEKKPETYTVRLGKTTIMQGVDLFKCASLGFGYTFIPEV